MRCSVENFDKIWTDLAPEDSPCGTPPGQEYSAFQAQSFSDLVYLLAGPSTAALHVVNSEGCCACRASHTVRPATWRR